MPMDDPNEGSFEETLRMIAAGLAQQIERAVESIDVDELADSMGLDPAAARSWIESAGVWLRAQTGSLGEESVGRSPQTPSRGDLLAAGQPRPLDLPTDEQGAALAALDSGRWTVEPGSHSLVPKDGGPAPSDALGIALELHIRDWIGADGGLTVAGRHALGRWLEARTGS